MNLTVRILIGMSAGLLLGVGVQALGLSPEHWLRAVLVDGFVDAGGDIFIRSLTLMVVPLVFVSLICGAASLGSHGNMGRVGGKTIGLYLITTSIAISIALLLGTLIAPGEGARDKEVELSAFVAQDPTPIKDTLVNIFPTNPIAAMAEGNMLQVIVFALLLGIALSRSGAAGQRVLKIFDDLNEILMKLITMLIELAPYGVFCLMLSLFANVGWQEIYKLIAYFLTVILALFVHAAIVYPSLLTLLGRQTIRHFRTSNGGGVSPVFPANRGHGSCGRTATGITPNEKSRLGRLLKREPLTDRHQDMLIDFALHPLDLLGRQRVICVLVRSSQAIRDPALQRIHQRHVVPCPHAAASYLF